MIQNKTYRNFNEYKRDHSMIGFRTLHETIINTDLVVTWVKGIDNPDKIERKKELSSAEFIRQLARDRNIKII